MSDYQFKNSIQNGPFICVKDLYEQMSESLNIFVPLLSKIGQRGVLKHPSYIVKAQGALYVHSSNIVVIHMRNILIVV